MTEKDTIIRLKDDEDNEYILYPATKAENIIGLKTVAISGSYNDLDNKPVNATTSKSGLMSNTDKSKLDGIAVGANKTVVDTALSSTSTNPVQNKVMNTALNNKAPKSHASTDTTYGTGTSSNYGHVKLSDSTSSTSSTGSGVAATPAAVKAAYDKAVSAHECANDKIGLNDIAYGSIEGGNHWFLSEIVNDVVEMNNAFYSNGHAGAEEVVNDVSQIISEKIAPPTTITIANNTSKHKSYADYICTGTSDQTVINNAIATLPDGGGKIVLLEGTYNISGSITVNKPNVTIEGMGNGTVLKRMFNDGSQWNSGVINITGNSCIVKELSIDGNNSAYTNIYNKGILLTNSCSNNVLDNVTVYNERVGIIACSSATHNRIKANISNVYTGVLLYCANYNTVSNCIISGVSNNGIECNWYSNGHIIEQNHISDMTNAGIYVHSNCKNEIISDNVVVKNDDTLYIIYIAGTYNLIVDNQLPNLHYTDASGGTTNVFENNV